MKYSDGKSNTRIFVIISVALLALVAVPLASIARTLTTSVTVVNDSSREIRNIYLSSVNADDWSPDLLDNSTIASGHSFTLNNIACDQQQVKVIAEDQDGCFVTTVVNCGDSATWTVTNESSRDCGH